MHDCEESTHRPARLVTAACAPARASSPADDASARASAPWPTTTSEPPPSSGREGPLRGKDRNVGNAQDGGPGDGNRTHPVDVDDVAEVADKADDDEFGEEEEGGGAKWKGEEEEEEEM